MKKTTYYEKTHDGKGGFIYLEKKGYIEHINSINPIRSVAVVFAKESNGWKATHLLSGMYIVEGYKTKEECKQRVYQMLNTIFKQEDTKFLQDGIEELNRYIKETTENNLKGE